MRQVAKVNTELFREVFKCFPDDSVRCWEKFEEWEDAQARAEEDQKFDAGAAVEARLGGVQGHLVEVRNRSRCTTVVACGRLCHRFLSFSPLPASCLAVLSSSPSALPPFRLPSSLPLPTSCFGN
jgi:hypothetical protein